MLIEGKFPGATRLEMLKSLTTWRVGGPALAVTVTSGSMLSDLLGLLHEEKIDSFVLGKGSNILASDKGCDRVLILLRGELASAEWSRVDDSWNLSCGGGTRLPSLAGAACTRGASGMEFAVGIPGTVGGAIFMNAGAYGGSISDHVTAVRCVDLSGGQHLLDPSECEFTYRSSVFRDTPLIVSGVEFQMPEADPDELRRNARSILALRREKLPLNLPSAGSVFRKPAADIAPGKIIEDAGLKGRIVGGAMVSRLHANFIVNTGGASSADVSTLISIVKSEVQSKTGILLDEEILYLGLED